MRRLCIGEHEQPLDAEYFCRSGTDVDSEIDCLAFFKDSNGRLSLNGRIANQLSALVLTRYSAEILSVHKRLERKTEYTGQWIQPNGSDEFEIPFDSKRRVESADVVRFNAMDWQVRLYDFQVIRIEVK